MIDVDHPASSGQAARAISCVLPTVGSPAPMSMICVTPASLIRYLMTRRRNARFHRTAICTFGSRAIIDSATARSGA